MADMYVPMEMHVVSKRKLTPIAQCTLFVTFHQRLCQDGSFQPRVMDRWRPRIVSTANLEVWDRTPDLSQQLPAMVSRRKILSRSRDDLNIQSTYVLREDEEDVWYQKEKLYKSKQSKGKQLLFSHASLPDKWTTQESSEVTRTNGSA
uniref:Uncharacterized protein n=1 Tax=Timema monikensis TaxID=170555 RepID=A0A7R9EK19_9NEOP|nr:unnamed protein product [Timema monikensis]